MRQRAASRAAQSRLRICYRGSESVREIGFEIAEIENLDRAADGNASLVVEFSDTGVIHVCGAVDLLGHQRHVFLADGFDCLHLLDRYYRVTFYVGVAQRDLLRTLEARDRMRPG